MIDRDAKKDRWSIPDDEPASGRYPTMAELKAVVTAELRDGVKNRPRHPQMQGTIGEVVTWFVGLCDKLSRGESPMQVKGSGESKWIWPYLSRMKWQANYFMHTTRSHQDMIIDCAAEGIRWRGEAEGQLLSLYGEFEKMRAVGVEAYRINIKNLLPSIESVGRSEKERQRRISISRAGDDA